MGGHEEPMGDAHRYKLAPLPAGRQAFRAVFSVSVWRNGYCLKQCFLRC